jgi:hypothetical protein
VNSWGYLPYVLLALAVSTVLAAGSWYAIERPAQRLKRLKFRRSRGTDPSDDPVVERVNLSHQSAAPHTVDELDSSVARANGVSNSTALGVSLGNAGSRGPSHLQK